MKKQDSDEVCSIDNGAVLRFRLDRTVKEGKLVSHRICNIDCIWCHHDYMDHSMSRRKAVGNDFFIANMQRVIEAVQPLKVLIRISGDGEPTLAGKDELLDLVEKTKKIPKVQQVKMTTNGVLLGPMALLLKESGLDGVTISLNSLDRNIYNFYAGKDRLNEVLSSIETCHRVGLKTKLNVILTRLNAREIPDFIDLANHFPEIIIKFFDLIPRDSLSKRLFLPIEYLERALFPAVEKVRENSDGYISREYQLKSGGRIQVKAASVNNCPNLSCDYRAICLEGCRTSIRFRADGILQPCGVRKDNIIDLISTDITDHMILDALQSGGKIQS